MMESIYKEAEDLIFGYHKFNLTYSAVNLGVIDRLLEKPVTASELAVIISCETDHVNRLCRSLSVIGILKAEIDGRYSVTKLGELFKNDGKSFHRFYLSSCYHHFYKPGSLMPNTIQSGKPMFDLYFGVSFFEHLNASKGSKEFDSFMDQLTKEHVKEVTILYDFSQFGTVIDVGGGKGQLLFEILEKFPKVKGVLFDQDVAVKEASTIITARGLNDRCSAVSGNFFESVPSGGDCYIMKAVIADWNDENSLKILRNIRKAMKPNGKLLLIDYIVGRRNDLSTTIKDINMMTIGGKVRTEKEFETLLEHVGFTIKRIDDVKHPISVDNCYLIEAVTN